MKKEERDSFDHLILDYYSDSPDKALLPNTVANSTLFFKTAYDQALDYANMHFADPFTGMEEIIDKTNFWPASILALHAPWNDKLDASKILHTTNMINRDSSYGDAVRGIADMAIAYQRMFGDVSTSTDSQQSLETLKQRAADGIEMNPSMLRVFIAIGIHFGISFTESSSEPLLSGGVSEREMTRLAPKGTFDGVILYEEALLKGVVDPPTETKVDGYFKDFGYMVQFNIVSNILDAMGHAAVVDPKMQKFTLSFYKQHKRMIFSEDTNRTEKAIRKLSDLVSAEIESAENGSPHEQSAAYLHQIVQQYAEMFRITHEVPNIAKHLIRTGYYELPR